MENVNNDKIYKIKKTSLKIDYFHSSIPLHSSADHCEKCGQSSLILILQYLFYTFAKGEIYIAIIWCRVCLQIEVIDYCSIVLQLAFSL